MTQLNRQQFRTAESLFHARDLLKLKLDTVTSGKGYAVSITSEYQDAAVLEAVQPALVQHFRAEITKIEGMLKQLGWNGQQ